MGNQATREIVTVNNNNKQDKVIPKDDKLPLTLAATALAFVCVILLSVCLVVFFKFVKKRLTAHIRSQIDITHL